MFGGTFEGYGKFMTVDVCAVTDMEMKFDIDLQLVN